MARSLDLDALTEDDMLQLLEEIFSRLSPQRLRDVRDTAEMRRKEKIEAAKNAVLMETRAKLGELELTLEEVVRPRPARSSSRRTRRDAGHELPVKIGALTAKPGQQGDAYPKGCGIWKSKAAIETNFW